MTTGHSNYPSGWAQGVNVRGMPILNSYSGKVFWVSSTQAGNSNGNRGTFDSPWSDVDFAVSHNTVKADRGDIIVCKASHAETLSTADAIDIDKTSIAILGLGTGSDMPTFTMSDAAGEFTIGSDNVSIINIKLVASVTVVLKGFNIEDGVSNTFLGGVVLAVDLEGTDEFLHGISMINNNTGTTIEGANIDMGVGGGATAGIIMDADTIDTTIVGCNIRGDYSVACIEGNTALSKDVLIEDNLLINGTSGTLIAQPSIQLLAGTTGTIRNNLCICNVSSINDAIVADTVMYDGNTYSETVGAAAVALPQPAGEVIEMAIRNAVADDGTDVLFTIAGGSVRIYALYATVEVDGDQSPVFSLLSNVDTGSDIVLATGINLSAANTVDTITITGGALAINVAGADTAIMTPIVVRAGTIDFVKDSGTSGALITKWHAAWAPIDVGATLVDTP